MSNPVEQAQAALAAAEAAYQSELESDSERVEGSGAQERRREEHQESLRNEVGRRVRELSEAVLSQTQQQRGTPPQPNMHQVALAECVMCGGTGGWPGLAGHVHCKPCNGTGKALAQI